MVPLIRMNWVAADVELMRRATSLPSQRSMVWVMTVIDLGAVALDGEDRGVGLQPVQPVAEVVVRRQRVASERRAVGRGYGPLGSRRPAADRRSAFHSETDEVRTWGGPAAAPEALGALRATGRAGGRGQLGPASVQGLADVVAGVVADVGDQRACSRAPGRSLRR